jgi:hypothetical protein
MKLTSKSHSKTSRVCLFGPPKSGKTQLASELSSHFNILWFDLENGYETLLKLPAAQQEKVELISLPDTKIYPIAIETMMKVVTGNKVSICEKHGKVSCSLCTKDNLPSASVCLNELSPDTIVVIDSLTQLSNSALSHITKNQPEDYKPQFDDWGYLRIIIEKFLSQIQQASYNVVCITHEEEVEFEDGRKKIVPVCGSSKSSRNTAKYFDHVVYAELKNRKHTFNSSSTFSNVVLTGSRVDIEVEKLSTPSLLPIFQRLIQEVKPAPTPAENALSSLQKLKLGAQIK